MFEPSWESLEGKEVPEWFRDAKFGIFLHWGIHSATEHHAWYGRKMYLQENPGDPEGDEVYQYHLANFGHPSEFGFKDFLPFWTGSKWDPDALAALFADSGAKYVVPVTMYHDNFDNFDSSFQPWNSCNFGPRRDVLGEWAAATRKHGMRIGASDHASRAWEWLAPSHGSDTSGNKAGVPYDGALTTEDGAGTFWEGYDPQDLYLKPHKESDPTPTSFTENWQKRIFEMLAKYELDLLYFDWDTLPHEHIGLEIAAKFYNDNPDSVVTVKNPRSTKAVVHDTEKGRFTQTHLNAWQCDTTINHDWFFIKDQELRMSAEEVIHSLIDIVSKNGNLLLNLGLRPDGTLEEQQTNALTVVGTWLKKFGEGIYATRPWIRFGQGPTNILEVGHELGEGHFNEVSLSYTPTDLRFTRSEDSLFVFAMAHGTEINFEVEPERIVSKVVRIDTGESLEFDQSGQRLSFRVPTDDIDAFAMCYKVS